MSIEKIKEQLRNNKLNYKVDVVERLKKSLAEYYVELNYQFAIKEINNNTIKKIEFEKFFDEYGIGVLDLNYKFINNDGEDDYVTSRIYITNVPFEGKTIFVRCLYGDSFSCSVINGKRFCNFSVKEFIESVRDIIEEINEEING